MAAVPNLPADRRALPMLGRDADAWDAVHEVFRRILESPAQFRREARPMTYIYRATTNVCLNLLRSCSYREPSAAEAALPAAATEPAVADSSCAEARDLLGKLAGSLDDRDGQIAALRFVDDLPQEEIAEIVGLSRKTVGRRLEEVRRRAAALAGRMDEEVVTRG